MEELIKKIVERLEKESAKDCSDKCELCCFLGAMELAINIIQEEAKAYNESVKGDLISRQSLLKLFENLRDEHETNAISYNALYEVILKQPTAYNEYTVSAKTAHTDWIPCSERLPDKEGEYIVTLRRWNCVTFANFKDIKNNPHFDNNYVIAWRPIIKPYQPKGE